MPQKYIRQAKHNHEFHQAVCHHFEDKYFDWKITVLFYIAIHYLKGLGEHRGIDLGISHQQIENNVNPHNNPPGAMPIAQPAWKHYKKLKYYSKVARYEGIIDVDDATYERLQRGMHERCIDHVVEFENYVVQCGVQLM